MLALVSHQIHLLNPHAAVGVLHILNSLLVEGGLAIRHILAAVLDLMPSFFQRLVSLLQLNFIVLLAGPDTIELLLLLLSLMLRVVVFGLCQLLLFLFHLLSFCDILLELRHVFIFDLHMLKFALLVHLLRYLNHLALELVSHLAS